MLSSLGISGGFDVWGQMTPWRRIGAMQSMFGTRLERGRAGRRADEKVIGRGVREGEDGWGSEDDGREGDVAAAIGDRKRNSGRGGIRTLVGFQLIR